MDAAEFIDKVLTPVAVGLGGFFGTKYWSKRNPQPAWMPWAVGVGAAVAFGALKWLR